ncbi:MAG: hypothetical protein V1847_04025 [Candidatus Diapherotrites archaeon]
MPLPNYKIVRKWPLGWLEPKDVKRVWITEPRKNAEPVLLGGYVFGSVFVGRMQDVRGKIFRVAVKRFNPIARMSPVMARRYNRVIAYLVRARVRLPKMGVVLTEIEGKPEFVLVMQLFGGLKKGSKLHAKSKGQAYMYNASAQAEAVAEVVKVGNAGYYPPADL